MTENKKDEIRNLSLEELESVAAGLFDANKITYEEMVRYMTLKNRFFRSFECTGTGQMHH